MATEVQSMAIFYWGLRNPSHPSYDPDRTLIPVGS